MRRTTLILALLTAAIPLSAASCSTANLSETKTCAKAVDNECAKDQTTFATDTPEIFVTTSINNAPKGTKLTFDWRYLEQGGVDIDSVVVRTKESGRVRAESSLTMPTQGWPKGRYEVVLKLDSENSKPVRKKFKVK